MLALAAWLALGPAEVAAAPSAPPAGITVEWNAAPGCPSRDVVETRLAELLGAPLDASARVDVRARVERVSDGFTLHLRLETAAGTDEHTLSSPDCEALADGAALVAAVAADPLAVDRTLQAPAVPTDTTPPDVLPEGPTKPVAPPVKPRQPLRLLRFALRAEGVLTHGVLPKLGFGPIVSLGLIGPHWRAELAAIYLAPRKVFADATHTSGVAISSWALRMRGCGVPVWRQLEFPLCAGFEGGQLSPQPIGTAAMASTLRDKGFGMFSAGGSIGYSPRPFIAVFAGVDAIVPLVRPGFQIAGMQVHRPDHAGVRASLGLELRVP